MNLLKHVPSSVTTKVGRLALKADKASPKLLFGAGLVGFGVTVVLASRATLKLEGALEQIQSDRELMHTIDHEAYSEEDRKQDKAVLYFKHATTVAKLYAPAFLVGSLSVICLTKSHNILTQRNAALTAAYAAVQESFRRYRNRVGEEYGEEKERELYYGSVVEEIKNDKTGKVKKKIKVDPNEAATGYRRMFNDSLPSWSPIPEVNELTLKSHQNYLNDILQLRGHVFLNEAYDRLGIERSTAGQAVGWIFEPENTERDNYIDFGVFDDEERVRDFVIGRYGDIALDFNVDGPIYDEIEHIRKKKEEKK